MTYVLLSNSASETRFHIIYYTNSMISKNIYAEIFFFSNKLFVFPVFRS